MTETILYQDRLTMIRLLRPAEDGLPVLALGHAMGLQPRAVGHRIGPLVEAGSVLKSQCAGGRKHYRLAQWARDFLEKRT